MPAMCLLLILTFCSVKQAPQQLQTVTDEAGRKVAVPAKIKRIVSLTPGLTEMIFHLGLDSKLVGVTSFCNYPVQARELPNVGGYSNPSLEKIIALKPDLVLGTTEGNSRPLVDKMASLGIPVYCIAPQDIDDIAVSLTNIGRLTGIAERAESLAAGFRQKVAAVRDAVRGPRPRVLLIIGENPLFSVGPGSFAHDILVSAGAENIADDAGIRYPRYSMENVLAKNPAIIIKCGMVKENTPDPFKEWHRWKEVDAVKNNRLYTIDSDLVLRPGPRLVEGVEKVAEIVQGNKSD